MNNVCVYMYLYICMHTLMNDFFINVDDDHDDGGGNDDDDDSIAVFYNNYIYFKNSLEMELVLYRIAIFFLIFNFIVISMILLLPY